MRHMVTNIYKTLKPDKHLANILPCVVLTPDLGCAVLPRTAGSDRVPGDRALPASGADPETDLGAHEPWAEQLSPGGREEPPVWQRRYRCRRIIKGLVAREETREASALERYYLGPGVGAWTLGDPGGAAGCAGATLRRSDEQWARRPVAALSLREDYGESGMPRYRIGE
ncbi:hypothetical protein NDU88_002770 [Pleurodeles waltl]|uniref:Uncharacterized protein n=1 Tax=Pleurodeles waltl TaxID=8319 RepID=A0AAV7KTS5_PLEWA|nr:hypothetical protein NDU88_002770 [Pleurodeles waltl]